MKLPPQLSFFANLFIFLSLGISIFFLLYSIFIKNSPLQSFGIGTSCHDFYAFWAAGKSLLSRYNPYDLELVQKIFQSISPACSTLAPVYAPPPIFILLTPISLLDVETAPKVWFLFSLLIFSTSFAYFLIRLRNNWLAGSLVLLTFPPFLFHLYLGQLIAVLLLCVLLVCSFKTNHFPWKAGIVAGLTIWKPHLTYLLMFALLLSSLLSRNFKFIYGFLISSIFLLALPLLFRLSIYQDYINAEHIHPFAWLTPTAGVWLKLIFSSHSHLLHLLPTFLALGIVSLWIVSKKNSEWTEQDLSFLIILSVITTPYIWTYDFVILLIPITTLLIKTLRPITCMVLLFIMNFVLWKQMDQMLYHAWYPLALLIMYLLFLPCNTWKINVLKN